ncbi:hypothetical protein [Chitinivibrio alkaliphilus]|uniref:Carboxypeptidase regulatory-like domain-containing protein n=1 Tax=Chitinivibrio alkaliphilus ACht1 TaxID=1313304 RepID=U7DDE0_9BACT|nr:hypothetical protein [Chitinivibrio alkaliphilus]ERP38901.1 hypothetical protein CALK_0387 [Chitinivibrio alkaliphilus ACht1]
MRLSFCLLLLILCSCSVDLAGPGSETGNPKVAGVIMHEDEPVEHGSVSFFPETPSHGIEGGEEIRTESNDKGVFSVSLPEGGRYRALAWSTDSSFGVTMPLDDIQEDIEFSPWHMDTTSSVQIYRGNFGADSLDVHMVATPFSAKVAPEKEFVDFDHVPPGNYALSFGTEDTLSKDSLTVYSGESGIYIIEASTVVVLGDPDDTVLVELLQYLHGATGLQYGIVSCLEEAPEVLTEAELVYITPDFAFSQTVADQIRKQAFPVLSGHGEYHHALGFGTDGSSSLYRETTSIQITEEGLSHPLAAFLNAVTVQHMPLYADTTALAWTHVGPDAKIIGQGITDQQESYVFLYSMGSLLADGTLAHGHRMGFPLSSSPLLHNGDARRLLAEMILWAVLS